MASEEHQPTGTMEHSYQLHNHAVEAITELAIGLQDEGIEPTIISEALKEVAVNITNNR